MPPASIPNASPSIAICATKCRCRYTTPFGTPVLPLVNSNAATSSGRVSASCGPPASKSVPAPSRSTSPSVASASHARLPVVMRTRADFAQPSSAFASSANGMPMNASGCASSRHCFSARRSMPGSTSTGTAPALNRANMTRKNSGVGRTITTARVPRTMPRLARPAAMASLRASSCAYVNSTSYAPLRPGQRIATWSGRSRARRGNAAAMLQGSLMPPLSPTMRAMPVEHPCLTCGACCAFFRVSFHWSEADPALGGVVPFELTEPLRTHERVMRGTSQAQPRCIALDADIGRYSRCTIHDRRPSVCALVPASWEFGAASAQCDKARIAHGLQALTPDDWIGVDEAEKNPLPEA